MKTAVQPYSNLFIQIDRYNKLGIKISDTTVRQCKELIDKFLKKQIEDYQANLTISLIMSNDVYLSLKDKQIRINAPVQFAKLNRGKVEEYKMDMNFVYEVADSFGVNPEKWHTKLVSIELLDNRRKAALFGCCYPIYPPKFLVLNLDEVIQGQKDVLKLTKWD